MLNEIHFIVRRKIQKFVWYLNGFAHSEYIHETSNKSTIGVTDRRKATESQVQGRFQTIPGVLK